MRTVLEAVSDELFQGEQTGGIGTARPAGAILPAALRVGDDARRARAINQDATGRRDLAQRKQGAA